MKPTIRQFAEKGLDIFILGGGVSFLFGVLGRVDWRLELLSHFRVQYLVLHAVAFLVALGLKKPRSAWIAGGFVALQMGSLLPFYAPITAEPASAPVYRVLLSNVLAENTEFDRVRALIQATDPDIILLLETNQGWLSALSLENAGYPYTVTAPRDGYFGLALYSRLPITHSQIVDLGGNGYFSIVAEIQLAAQTFTLVGTHPPPPLGDGSARRRNHQLREVADFVSSQPGNLMLLGDLNITSWSPFFVDTIGKTNLRDSRLGFGVQPSWSMNRPFFLRIPIDHIFTTEAITVLRRATGPDIGSDHLPVILDFTLP